jgi:hypothetical protein
LYRCPFPTAASKIFNDRRTIGVYVRLTIGGVGKLNMGSILINAFEDLPYLWNEC